MRENTLHPGAKKIAHGREKWTEPIPQFSNPLFSLQPVMPREAIKVRAAHDYSLKFYENPLTGKNIPTHGKTNNFAGVRTTLGYGVSL
jgi:hypothetical protein